MTHSAGYQPPHTLPRSITVRKQIGILAAVGFVLTVVGANWAINHFGIVSVGFGYSAPAAVYFIGAALILRDIVQWAMGRPAKPRPVDVGAMLALIGVGAGCRSPSPPRRCHRQRHRVRLIRAARLRPVHLGRPPLGRAVLAGGLVGAVARLGDLPVRRVRLAAVPARARCSARATASPRHARIAARRVRFPRAVTA
jgi:hypothetical protein